MNKAIYWTPRILGIAFAGFISLFALDVFGEYTTIGEMAIALLVHLLPTAIVVAVLVVAWRWGWIGGSLYILAGISYAVMVWQRMPDAVLWISGPLWVTGLLFIWSWVRQRNALLPPQLNN